MMSLREGKVDKNGVLILDIRAANPLAFEALHILKSQVYQIPLNLTNENLSTFKSMIHFKHVFLVGEHGDFENGPFLNFL